jgi:hypothetical protein
MASIRTDKRPLFAAATVIERFLDANHPCQCGPDDYCPGNADEALTLAKAVLEALPRG